MSLFDSELYRALLMMQHARESLEAGRVDEARMYLDDAYQLVKTETYRERG